MENPKFIEILRILKANDRIPLADIAESVESQPKEVFKCIVTIINERFCQGKIVGGLNGVFIAEAIVLSQVDAPAEKSVSLLVKEGGTVNWVNADRGANVGGTTFAKDTVTRESCYERIVPFEITTPPELLQNLRATLGSYRETEGKRLSVIEEIDKLDGEKGELRRKLNKSTEERDRFGEVSSQVEMLSEKLDKLDSKMSDQHNQLRTFLSETTAKTVDGITVELEKQSAKIAANVVSSNKELIQLLESVSITINAKLEVQKEDIGKISSLLELSDQHLNGIVTAIDGQPDDKKLDLREQIISSLKSSISDVAKNPQEMTDLLNKIFDQKTEVNGRINALKGFFTKSKKWIDDHPQVVQVLRTLFFGALTGMGVQVPKI